MGRSKKPGRSTAPHAMTEAQYRIDPEQVVAAAIDAPDEVNGPLMDEAPPKPRLLVENCNPDVTVAVLARHSRRSWGPLRQRRACSACFRPDSEGRRRASLDAPCTCARGTQGLSSICAQAKGRRHYRGRCSPPAHLCHDVSRLAWRMEPAAAKRYRVGPLLQDDGTISSIEGYDHASGMWCEDVPDLTGLFPSNRPETTQRPRFD